MQTCDIIYFGLKGLLYEILEQMMKKEYVMGNAAIALGAIAAGVNVVCGYPGTPVQVS